MRTPFTATGLSGLSGVSALAPGGTPPPPPPVMASAPAAARGRPGAGGVADLGFAASFWPTTDRSGPPAFTTKALRLTFDWPTGHQPGGADAPGFRDVPAAGWSAVFTGRLLPAFTETYTVTLLAGGTCGVRYRVEGAGSWTTLFASATQAVATARTADVALAAGTRYEVEITYAEGGDRRLHLAWACPSAPAPEVIESALQMGDYSAFNADSFASMLHTQYRNTWESYLGGGALAPQDADGWPTTDGTVGFFETGLFGLDMEPMSRGRVAFSFTGQATLAQRGNWDPASLTYSYDAGTNTTTGTLTTLAGTGGNACQMVFTNTKRTAASATNTGITNLKFQKPVAPDATTSLDPAHRFHPLAVAGFRRTATVLRLQLLQSPAVTWADRTRPTYANQATGPTLAAPADYYYPDQTRFGGCSVEWAVHLCNLTGCDLHLSLPVKLNDTAVKKYIQTLMYGSDGSEPYPGPTANPVWPPLNPNLRVYLELGNELWNFGSGFDLDWYMAKKEADVEAASGSALGAALAATGFTLAQPPAVFGQSGTAGLHWAAARTAQVGRHAQVAAPAAWAAGRLRPVFGIQYGDSNNTATGPLGWLRGVLETTGLAAAPGRSDAVGLPAGAGVHRYIWGASAATYYGSASEDGVAYTARTVWPGTEIPYPAASNDTVPGLLADRTFASPPGASGLAVRPARTNTVWTGPGGLAAAASCPAALDAGRTQALWLAVGGAVTITFTAPATQTFDRYGFVLRMLHRQTTTRAKLRVILDEGTGAERDISLFGKDFEPYAPADGAPAVRGWNARFSSIGESLYYPTEAFPLAAGSAHTVTLRCVGPGTGSDTPGATDPLIFVTLLDLASGDLVGAGFSLDGAAGAATGQVQAGSQLDTLRIVQERNAAFGLNACGYEGGMGIGPDGRKTPLAAGQVLNYAASARAAHQAYIARSFRSGYVLVVEGTYARYPKWDEPIRIQGLLDLTQWQIPAAVVAAAADLPEPVEFDYTLPAVLPLTADTYGRRAAFDQALGFAAWACVARTGGTFAVTLTGAAGCSVRVGGEPVAGGAVTLPPGAVGVRIDPPAGGTLPASGASVTLAPAGTVAGPALTTFSPGFPAAGATSGGIALAWDAVPGATGYVIRWGYRGDGRYPQKLRAVLGAVTSHTLANLPLNTPVTVAVAALTAAGEGVPGPSRTVGGLVVDGTVVNLARFAPTGYLPGGTMAATEAANGVTVAPLARAAGLSGDPVAQIAFGPAGTPTANVWATTADAAVAAGEYFETTLTVAAGRVLDGGTLTAAAHLQSDQTVSGSGVSRAAVRYRVGTGAWVDLGDLPVTGTATRGGSFSLAALAGVSQPVTIRVVPYDLYYYTTATVTGLTVTGSTRPAPTGPTYGPTVTLAGWVPAAKTTDGVLPPATAAAGVTASAMTCGTGTYPYPGALPTYGVLASSVTETWGGGAAGAVAADRSIGLTVTPGAGQFLRCDALAVAGRVVNATAGDILIRYRVGAGAWADLGTLAPDPANSSDPYPLARAATLPLTGVPALQGVTAAVEFRAYMYGVPADEYYRLVSLDTVTLTGAVGV